MLLLLIVVGNLGSYPSAYDLFTIPDGLSLRLFPLLWARLEILLGCYGYIMKLFRGSRLRSLFGEVRFEFLLLFLLGIGPISL